MHVFRHKVGLHIGLLLKAVHALSHGQPVHSWKQPSEQNLSQISWAYLFPKKVLRTNEIVRSVIIT